MNQEYIICPICGKKLKSLNMHIVYKHNLTTEEFKIKYPDFGLMQIPCKKVPVECPICGKKLKSKTALGMHIAYIHNGLKRNDPENHKDKKTKGWKCPICGKFRVNFSQHIELNHGMKWEEFVEKYNWTKDKTFVTEEHKKNLSVNKKIFYNDTERGKELRIEQSESMSGKGNIIHLPGVREKVSIAAANRIINDDPTYFYRIGIRVKYKNFHFRSLEEFKIALSLLENNIDFEYESESIAYLKDDKSLHNYVIDFKINGFYYEIKTGNIKEEKKKTKYIQAKKILKDFKIVTFKELMKILNIKTTNTIQSFFIQKCKDLLNTEDIEFSKYSKTKNYSFFKKIDDNYLNNKKFICI